MMKLTTLLSTVLLFNINIATTFLDNINTTSINETENIIDPPKIFHNANVGIFPGKVVTKTYVPKSAISAEVQQDFIVTGLEADEAENGEEIIVHATVGKISLLNFDSRSSRNNRIYTGGGTVVLNQGQSAELKYNASYNLWVVTSIQ